MIKKNKGFTLVEVLVALIIIAIALTAVIRSTIESTEATVQLRDRIAAHWVGMDVLSNIQTGLMEIPRDSDLPPGKTDMMGKQWKWIVSTTNSYEYPSMMLVKVQVSSERRLISTVEGYAKR